MIKLGERFVFLQDNDFKVLRPGDPVFQLFSGETVKHEGDDLYPLFVNECAYYEKKVAFKLTKKITVTLPSVGVKKDWEDVDIDSNSNQQIKSVHA